MPCQPPTLTALEGAGAWKNSIPPLTLKEKAQ